MHHMYPAKWNVFLLDEISHSCLEKIGEYLNPLIKAEISLATKKQYACRREEIGRAHV